MSGATTSSEVVLRLRAARNRIIDALGIGETYPVRDLPVPNDRLMVPFNTPASIRVEDSEKRVAYAPRDRHGIQQGGVVTGNGGEIVLATPAIRDDITFTVHARTPLGREADLLAAATVRVGLDLSIAAMLLPENAPLPWVIDFGAGIPVLIPFSQDGVDYRLVRFQGGDPAHPDDMAAATQDEILSVSGATVRGTGGAIQLPSVPLRDDLVVRIRAIKMFDPALGRPPQTNLLAVRLPVFVRPDTSLAVTGDPGPVVDFQAASGAGIAAAAAGVEYRPVLIPVADAMYAQGAAPGLGLIAVPVPGQPNAMIRLPAPIGAGAQDVPPGYTLGSDWTKGAGTALRLALPPAETDTLVRIAARKTHQGPSGPFVSSVWLTATMPRLVRPNPAQPLTLTVTLTGNATDGNLTIVGSQPGVFYTPRLAAAGAPMLPPAYAHQPDPEGLSPWKGIGQMKLEVDFAVARPGQPPLPPVLAAGALPVGTTLAIQAMKAQSRATADMAATASIDAVPAVALQAALVDYAAPAQMRVSGSQAGEQYALWREAATGDVAGGSPQDGNGAALDFASGPLTADTVLVLTTTGKAAIPVSRRVRLPVAVRPNPGLTVKARDLTVPQGGSTQILVDASQPSVLYQLMAGAAAVGGPVTGTGAPIALPVGPLAATTAFSVVASRVNPPAGSVTLSTTVTVTVKP